MEEKKCTKEKLHRGSGILLHISSLPSPYGIGTLGQAAYDFIDFLKAAGQSYWQILPLGPTGFGDSPYQTFSAYAGNPYFIDLDLLKAEGLLTLDEIQAVDFGEDPERVDYGKLYQGRLVLLERAYERFIRKKDEDWEIFQRENVSWLEDYCLYMAIKEGEEGLPWTRWKKEFRDRDEETLDNFRQSHRDRLNYFSFLQYEFFKQWEALKAYANENHIAIIGDIPIYVAEDSADTWSSPEVFQLDEKKFPVFVGGCPPDDFSNTGQLWGNPVYDWEVLEEQNYAWWIRRIEWSFKIYDILRIDHFRGFESYWKIPYGDSTAVGGHWEKGPAMKLFDEVRRILGDLPIIAEDLGFMTEEVLEFREATGFPGMKILQFAFNPTADSDYLPHNFIRNCVVYTGTHDNDTIAGWKVNAPLEDLRFAEKYLNIRKDESLNHAMIRGALASVAEVAIFQMQDFLGLDNSARMNNPGILGGNWVWRMQSGVASPKLAEKIGDLCMIYGRLKREDTL